jgi:hypothetical protein
MLFLQGIFPGGLRVSVLLMSGLIPVVFQEVVTPGCQCTRGHCVCVSSYFGNGSSLVVDKS